MPAFAAVSHDIEPPPVVMTLVSMAHSVPGPEIPGAVWKAGGGVPIATGGELV